MFKWSWQYLVIPSSYAGVAFTSGYGHIVARGSNGSFSIRTASGLSFFRAFSRSRRRFRNRDANADSDEGVDLQANHVSECIIDIKVRLRGNAVFTPEVR